LELNLVTGSGKKLINMSCRILIEEKQGSCKVWYENKHKQKWWLWKKQWGVSGTEMFMLFVVIWKTAIYETGSWIEEWEKERERKVKGAELWLVQAMFVCGVVAKQLFIEILNLIV
jgi:hypothetical protein